MNKKGFTLIELMGVIIILSIIMLIAIPNIASMVERSKRDTYITDAKKMISLAKYQVRKGTVFKPAAGQRRIVTLNALSTNDVEKDSDGNAYDINNSYVVIIRNGNELNFYVQLVSTKEGSSKIVGISCTKEDNLDGENKYDTYSTNTTIVDSGSCGN